MKFIHLECVRQWLKGKVTMRQVGTTTSYYWKQLSCELCKELLPSSILINGRHNELIDILRPATPYVMLEIKATDFNGLNSLHVVSILDSSTVLIVRPRQGRGYESEVRVPDISVSRVNSAIRLVKNDFYLSDHKSKFGTLMYMKNQIQLTQGTEISSKG